MWNISMKKLRKRKGMQYRKKVHFRRNFLNKNGQQSDASIFTKIEIHDGYKGVPYLDVEFKIRDCERTVRLDFDEGDQVHKVDVLINHLIKFKEGLTKAKKLVKELKQKQLKNKK
jgi:hypothetical protein